MKNKAFVIKKNRKVNYVVTLCLLIAVPAILVLLLNIKYRNDTERLLVWIGAWAIWFVFALFNLYFYLWKISFNDEEFKIRRFFFTKTYRRDNVIGVEESRVVRGGYRQHFQKIAVVTNIIRRKDNNRKIAVIKDHFMNSEKFRILIVKQAKNTNSK